MTQRALDRDAIEADLTEAIEQVERADNASYDAAEPRIWHCTAAIRRLVEAVRKVTAVLP